MWGKPKGPRKRELRIYFATDIHGSEVCFRKFLAAARVYEADVLLLGGDFAGKGLVPVLRDGGELRTEIDGKQVSVPADGWDQLTADINRRGFYAAQMEPEARVILCTAEPHWIEEARYAPFDPAMTQRNYSAMSFCS